MGRRLNDTTFHMRYDDNQVNLHAAPIVGINLAGHEPQVRQLIDEFDGCMVTNEQTLGDLANAEPLRPRSPLNGEEGPDAAVASVRRVTQRPH